MGTQESAPTRVRPSELPLDPQLPTHHPPPLPTMAKAAAPKKRVVKKQKDPNAPKKAQSAYMIFCNENRPIVKEENPDASFGEMGKLLGARWKELSDEGKKPYNDKAEQDKGRYEREKQAYVPDDE